MFSATGIGYQTETVFLLIHGAGIMDYPNALGFEEDLYKEMVTKTKPMC